MQKYTVIWNDYHVRGSNRFCVTKKSRIEVMDIREIMESSIGDDIVYIFVGWPLMQGETEQDVKADDLSALIIPEPKYRTFD